MDTTKEDAFTLIELSIVLVIIGLIVGGILLGKDLIQQAEMRSVITQIEHYKTATHTFRDKYNALPGDMANAGSYWNLGSGCGSNAMVQASDTCNGNGDGVIAAPVAANGFTISSEMSGFWNHLAHANLIEGQYRIDGGGSNNGIGHGKPGDTIPGSYHESGVELLNMPNGFQDAATGITNGKHVFVIAYADNYSWPNWGALDGNHTRAFTPNQARIVDKKMDDGLPYSGNVSATWDANTDSCGKSNSGSNEYILSDMLNRVAVGGANMPYGCALYFNGGF